ncbi:condensation domain-containing protein [Bacillus wiedmannii]|uniref:condensation domain-containing protein n=1 Tax=Bacillus wiedmannii TaxID=1890302 RepID=UPI0026CA18B4
MEKINPHQPLHNIGGTVKIQGEVDFVCLEKAINYFIKKNDGIRHRFVESDEKVHQYVEEYHKYQVRYTIFNSQNDLDAWVQQEAAKPFDINEQDLFDFALFKLQDTKEGGYFVKVHHIISDGWSMNLLTEQICNAYTQILKGEKITDQLNSTYMYCLEKEESYLTSKRFMKDKNFWNEKFSKLPIVKRKNEVDCAKANRKTYSLTSNQSDEIKQFATGINVSVYAFFVALYYIYLNKVNGQDDLIIGMPVLNRAGKNEKILWGC